MNQIFNKDTLPYRRLTAACGILQALDHRNVQYKVEDTYFDFVAGSMWTTIIGYENGGKYQALDRYHWDRQIRSTTAEVIQSFDAVENFK